MLAPVLFALTQPLDAPFNAPAFEGSLVSICVRDHQGSVVFEKNSSLRLMPASNQKLLTCAFALHTLGPDFRPKTRIWKTPNRTVVESYGDPLLTYSRLMDVAATLKLDKHKPVYVKESYSPGWPQGWELDDLPNKYASPVTAFTVDRGSFELWNDNGKPRLEPTAYLTKIRWAFAPHEPIVRYDPFHREVTVVGMLAKERKRLDTLSLPKPDEAAAWLLGGYFHRTTEVPQGPPTAILEGNTIAENVAACLPPSDNNISENLLLMSAQRFEPLKENPYPQARLQLTNFITRVVGVPSADIKVSDGSGMSRHNLFTTRGLSQLLVWTSKQPYGRQYRDALPRPGQPGTLRDRLIGTDFVGKTGSLDMVVSLTGFVRGKSGKEFILSVICNNFTGESTEVRNATDQFVKNLASQY